MDILMIILPALSVFGSIYLAVSKIKKTFGLKVSGSSSTNMLNAGAEREKAKVLEKEPQQNPDVVAAQNYNMAGGNVGIPMNSYGAQGASMPNIGAAGGGFGANAIIGVVNGIGGIMQSGDVSNRFIARRQITGPILQDANMIYNSKLRGSKSLRQEASSILNTANGGRLTMNQGSQATNRIAGRRVLLNPNGTSNSYIYGNVRGLKSGYGNIYTKALQIKGISKAQTLITKQFIAPKGTYLKMQQLANGNRYGLNQPGIQNVNQYGLNQPGIQNVNQYGLNPGLQNVNQYGLNPLGAPNVSVVMNDINFHKKIVGYLMQDNKFRAANPKQQLSMLVLQDVYGDKNNANLKPSQKRELYIITRTQKSERLLAAGGEKHIGQSESTYKKDLMREVIQMAPNLTRQQKIQVYNRAIEMKNARRKDQQLTQQALAEERTNQKMNLNQENRKALDELLRDTTVSTHYNNYLDENFDNVHQLSEEEIKEIEHQARENVRKRDDLSLEEKEAEYERLKEEMQASALESRLEEIEGIVKEEILDNPDEAREILGEEGAELLRAKLAKIQEERDAMYQKLLKMQKRASRSSYEEFKKRRDEEMKADITAAVNELYPDQGSSSQAIIPFVSRQAQENELTRSSVG